MGSFESGLDLPVSARGHARRQAGLGASAFLDVCIDERGEGLWSPDRAHGYVQGEFTAPSSRAGYRSNQSVQHTHLSLPKRPTHTSHCQSVQHSTSHCQGVQHTPLTVKASNTHLSLPKHPTHNSHCQSIQHTILTAKALIRAWDTVPRVVMRFTSGDMDGLNRSPEGREGRHMSKPTHAI